MWLRGWWPSCCPRRHTLSEPNLPFAQIGGAEKGQGGCILRAEEGGEETTNRSKEERQSRRENPDAARGVWVLVFWRLLGIWDLIMAESYRGVPKGL